MDPDPETESQNVAEPTDPDPKHWLQVTLNLNQRFSLLFYYFYYY